MPPLIKLNVLHVLALAAFGIVMGNWLKQRFRILDTLNIPSPVLGGLVYAVTTTVLRDRAANFEMDMVLRDVLMIAFFTTIGMSASLRLLRVGGVQVAIFFALATAGCILQNAVGIAAARMLGLDELLGIISGSVALAGGPATALAFGADFEQRFGLAGALPFGLASAMFGITAGGLISGFLGGRLIERHKLAPGSDSDVRTSGGSIAYAHDDVRGEPTILNDESEAETSPLMHTVVLVAIAMGIGTLISVGFERAQLVLPSYIGAMFAAALLRNIDDMTGWFGISQRHMDSAGSIALNLFIVMALLTLRLWELLHLALPMFVMLFLQLALVVAMVHAAFLFMGRDYEAAVMGGGFAGFMLGTTANAMACLEVLAAKYGPAPRAYLVVPIVGAFLIDFTNAMVITAFANLLR